MKRDYLLEIGCENIPSGYLESALGQLKDMLESGLRERRVGCGGVTVLGTPNRLVLHITDMDEKQETLVETITGPPLARAVDENGSYNNAAVGFARSKGVEVDDLIRVTRDKGEYVAVEKKTPGLDTADLLAGFLPELIAGVRFPKDMRWDSSGLIFARPVRWLVSLLSQEELKLRLGTLESGRETRLKPYSDRYTGIDSVNHYFELMKKEGIILDPRERSAAVIEAVEKEAGKLGGTAVLDEELVDTVSNLLENPVPLAGRYDERFLKLPRKVVIAALKGHQKYFSVENDNGELLPFFICFADGVSENLEEITAGNERVLEARLYDAEFYYREDTSGPLSEMAAGLKNIVWMRGLGTLAEKSERVKNISVRLRQEWLPGKEKLDEILSRAAILAKADLASEMVKDGKEFTRLQGYIGREYARKSGESGEVSDAIYEHYLPRFAGDALPETEAGIIISCADRLDNIAGGFLMKLDPTGSQDPYALRRQALGLLRIMIERDISVPLERAVEQALSMFDVKKMERAERSPDEAAPQIYQFIVQRLSGLLKGKRYRYDRDLVDAVLAGGWKAPAEAVRLISELGGMRENGELGGFVTAMKRIANIIPDQVEGVSGEAEPAEALKALSTGNTETLPFSEELFEEQAEKSLFRSSVSVSADLARLQEEGWAEGVFGILDRNLTGPVNRFFEEVMVNCEDERIRRNRHSFLRTLQLVFSHFCDYAMIEED